MVTQVLPQTSTNTEDLKDIQDKYPISQDGKMMNADINYDNRIHFIKKNSPCLETGNHFSMTGL